MADCQNYGSAGDAGDLGGSLSGEQVSDMVLQLGAVSDLRQVATQVVKYSLDLTGARWAEVVDTHRHHQFRILASTDEALSRALFEARQLSPSNPPLPPAVPASNRIVIDDLASDGRWTSLTRVAASLPVRSAVLQYLAAEGRYTAGLAVYDDRPGFFTPSRIGRIGVLSCIAAPLLAGAAAVETVGQLTNALRTNRVIASAVGIVMVRTGVGRDEAFDWLVRRSQRQNIKLYGIAEAIVAHPQDPLP